MTVYDDKAGKYVPVTGVKIRCNVVVKWSTTFTNSKGEYKMDSKFTISPYYEMVFDNQKGFVLWHKFLSLAVSNHGMGWHNLPPRIWRLARCNRLPAECKREMPNIR